MAGLDRETLDMILSTLKEYAERKLTPKETLPGRFFASSKGRMVTRRRICLSARTPTLESTQSSNTQGPHPNDNHRRAHRARKLTQYPIKLYTYPERTLALSRPFLAISLAPARKARPKTDQALRRRTTRIPLQIVPARVRCPKIV